MTQQFPIIPPPALVQQWASEWTRSEDSRNLIDGRDNFMSARAAQWGADRELDACIKWLSEYLPCLGDWPMPENKLRTARRPEPSTSLRQQALAIFDKDQWSKEESSFIRQALESLPN